MTPNQLLVKSTRVLIRHLVIRNFRPLGSGAGKGGSDGGHSSKSGGPLGEMGAAREDEYFYKKEKEQLNEVKQKLKKEIAFHEQQIRKKKKNIKLAEQELDEME